MIQFNEKYHYLAEDNPCKKCGCNVRYKYDNRCVECRKKSHDRASKKYTENNKETINEKNKVRYHENLEESRKRNRKSQDKYWQKHRDEINKRYRNRIANESKEERETRLEKRRKRRNRETDRQYRLKNKDKIKEQNKKYEQKNKDKVNARKRKWYNHNREKALAKTHKYRAKKRGNGGSYTAIAWVELCTKYGMRCLRCKIKFDISQLTVDHVIPVSKGGTSNIENLQPLCGSCNSAKRDMTIDYRPYYVY